MKNREQIRASNALKTLEAGARGRGVDDGDALTGFPALIIGNGLLATIAFSKKSGGGYIEICDAIAKHLSSSGIDILPTGTNTTDAMLNKLLAGESSLLRYCTAEALAFLNFLRRFAKAKN